MKVVVTLLLALALHLALGWGWTLLAGVVGGFWAGRGGWLTGLLGVGTAWLALIAYNYIVALDETVRMTWTMGGMLGNLPGAAVVAFTLLIGLVLGALGGLIGTQSKLLLAAWRART